MEQIKSFFKKIKWETLITALFAIAIGIVFIVVPQSSADVICIVLGSVLIALGAYVCFCIGTSGAGTNRLQSSTDREIGRIEEQQRQVGAEISRAGAEVVAAEDALDRAGGAVSNSQERARAVQAGIEECQELARECQGLARANAKIIAELGKDD